MVISEHSFESAYFSMLNGKQSSAYYISLEFLMFLIMGELHNYCTHPLVSLVLLASIMMTAIFVCLHMFLACIQTVRSV